MGQEVYQKIAQDISEMPVPKYYRLKLDIINKINTGVWTDHAKLPSENEFCKQYGVSRITVRKTLDELVASRYIYKVQGKGTYVAPKEQREIVLTKSTYGCGAMLRAQGNHPSHRILVQKLVPCPEEIAHSLSMQEGEPVFLYVRTYYGDDRPMIHAQSYINHHRLPGIERINLTNRSLSTMISEEYGLTVSNERCMLHAISADPEIGAALGVNPGFPVLLRNSIAIASNGVDTFPLEASQLYYRTDSAPYIVQG